MVPGSSVPAGKKSVCAIPNIDPRLLAFHPKLCRGHRAPAYRRRFAGVSPFIDEVWLPTRARKTVREVGRGIGTSVMCARAIAIVGPLLALLFAGCASLSPGTRGEETQGAALKPALKAGVVAATKQKAPPLDLTSLEKRLKDTQAIGELAKMSLKNEVTDLVNQFREFHEGKLKTTLAELRQPYDQLVLKVLALLRDADPPLAAAIVASREAIWAILADPKKFAAI